MYKYVIVMIYILQEITFSLVSDKSERVILSTTDDRLQEVTAFRWDVHEVTGIDSALIELHILGCAEGKLGLDLIRTRLT